MPAHTIKIGQRERLEAGVLKGTPLGALGTEALVHIGATTIQGPAAALRALADACQEAASMAEEYDADPEGWIEREREHHDEPARLRRRPVTRQQRRGAPLPSRRGRYEPGPPRWGPDPDPDGWLLWALLVAAVVVAWLAR